MPTTRTPTGLATTSLTSRPEACGRARHPDDPRAQTWTDRRSWPSLSDLLALIKAGDGVDGYGLENHAGRIVDVTGPPSATRP
jgi:hypothetical protein